MARHPPVAERFETDQFDMAKANPFSLRDVADRDLDLFPGSFFDDSLDHLFASLSLGSAPAGAAAAADDVRESLPPPHDSVTVGAILTDFVPSLEPGPGSVVQPID